MLGQAPDTELDNFYPRAILDEKYVRDQRQYLVSWHESVTGKHKKGNKRRISQVVQESVDGKFALVEWKDTWEKGSEMDGDVMTGLLRSCGVCGGSSVCEKARRLPCLPEG